MAACEDSWGSHSSLHQKVRVEGTTNVPFRQVKLKYLSRAFNFHKTLTDILAGSLIGLLNLRVLLQDLHVVLINYKHVGRRQCAKSLP